MATYIVPLISKPQTLSVALAGVNYSITVEWRDGWCMTLATNDGPLIKMLPLVTGTNLLGQYRHLNIGGSLYVLSSDNALADPTQDNLGSGSNLYFVTQ